MIKKLFYLLPVALVLLLACNSSTDNETNRKAHEANEMNKEATGSNHQHVEGQNTVELDSGKKWKANPETITGINNMLALVQDGIAGKAALSTLYKPLELEFKTIFYKCTMTGQSHNQLHNYLLSLKEHLEKFKEGNVSTQSLKEMQQYLLTFKNYFE